MNRSWYHGSTGEVTDVDGEEDVDLDLEEGVAEGEFWEIEIEVCVNGIISY